MKVKMYPNRPAIDARMKVSRAKRMLRSLQYYTLRHRVAPAGAYAVRASHKLVLNHDGAEYFAFAMAICGAAGSVMEAVWNLKTWMFMGIPVVVDKNQRRNWAFRKLGRKPAS